MSFRVLIVPEDPTYNGYILKPLVERILQECGRPRAHVELLQRPRPAGYDTAVHILRSELTQRYAHMDLALFLPDADGLDRTAAFTALEQEVGRSGAALFCCAAVQEVEAWLLAGHVDQLPSPWREVRDEVHVKERFFQPFVRHHGNTIAAGQGREQLMRVTLQNYAGLLARCPELAALQQRISDYIRTLPDQA